MKPSTIITGLSFLWTVLGSELPYFVSLKSSETIESFLEYDLNYPKTLQVKAFIKNSFSIGNFSGFSGNFSEAIVNRLLKCPMVSEITQDVSIKSLELVVQDPAPRHLARLSQRKKLSTSYPKYFYDDDYNGQGVLAYVIDSGIDKENPEFEERVSFGIDLTGEGPEDHNGHGSHVAGIIGSKLYGVSKGVQIIDVKALDKLGGGSLSRIIAALEFAVNHRLRSGKPGVANLSLGSSKNSALDGAISAAIETGLIIVVAAGNSNSDACYTSPACVPKAITVGAIDDLYDSIATFSNWGKCVDVFASGVFVASINYKDRKHAQYHSGTSMASPIVAGLIANLLSQGVAPNQVKKQVIKISTRGAISRTSLFFKRKTRNRVAFSEIDFSNSLESEES